MGDNALCRGMMMKATWRMVSLVLALVAGMVSQPASAVEEPMPLAVDSRIRTVLYNENEVFHFVGHYGFQSSIEFDEEEEVQTISIGDSVAWQIIPSGRRIFLKPVEPDANTNMSVVTSEHVYQFELDAKETEDVRDKEMVFVLRFVYPKNEYVRNFSLGSQLPDLEGEPEKYNFSYTLSGPDNIAPIRIFDDGTFTFFEFPNKNAEVPAFFTVENDDSESILNYRVLGDYIVVERLAPRFTLRHGADIVCVFNENLYRGKEKPKEKKEDITQYQRKNK